MITTSSRKLSRRLWYVHLSWCFHLRFDITASYVACAVLLQLTYLTTLSSVGDLKARGPQLVRGMMGWARPVAGGVSAGFYPVKCALGLSFYEHSTGTVLLPLLLFVSFAAVEAPVAHRAGVGLAAYKDSLVTCSVMVAYLLYPSVVEAVLTGMWWYEPP